MTAIDVAKFSILFETRMPQSKRTKTEQLPKIQVVLQDDTKLDLKTVDNAVFFFFPKAATSGCQKQATNYQEELDQFEEKGISVYGVSKDTCKVLSGWKSKEDYSYSFISDKNGDFAKEFGLNKDKTTIRGHVVVKDGKVIDVCHNVKPLESVSKALEAFENPPVADDAEEDEPVRKEAGMDQKKDVDMKDAPASPKKGKVVVQTSPKKVGKEIPVKSKEEVIHSPSHDKQQETLKGKVQKELKVEQANRQKDMKAKEQTKELKKEVLAEIKK